MRGRFLVIEPYDDIRELLEAALRRTGHEVAAVKAGAEAISAMEREHFPCVVVGSPVIVDTGDAEVLFLEYIERHCPQWRPCLIVLTTHVEAGQIVAAAGRLRVCAVLAKPFAVDDLLNVAGRCLTEGPTPTLWIGIPEHVYAPATAAPSAAAPDVSK